MVSAPPTYYASTAGLNVAYQVLGDGPDDLLYVPTGLHPIDLMWDEPVISRGLRRLAGYNRLIACDLVGVGSSDPVFFTEMPAMQSWADGIGAVLDASNSERASIFATAESCSPAMLYAASHPERIRSLVLWAPFARFERAPDHEFGMPSDALSQYLDAFVDVVGTGALVEWMAPARRDDERFREWWARCERLSAGRGYFKRILELFLGTDVRAVLGSIQAPTLVIRRVDDWHVRAGHAAQIVEQVPQARLVECPGDDHVWFSGDTDSVLDVVEEFVTGERHVAQTNRVLATVLFTDIVSSTEVAATLGDTKWTATLDLHNALITRHVTSFRGRVIKFTGDGVLAVFDGPARAIECAEEITSVIRALGLEVRAGLHTGEVETVDDDVQGIAVHIAARIMALAGAGEVLVSGSIPPLVLGSGLRFEDLGTRALRGVPDPWPVYRLVNA
jgi:class 3 adenylate cyclase